MRLKSKYTIRELLLFLEAYMGIIAGKAMVLFVPFQKTASWLGKAGVESTYEAPADYFYKLQEIKRAIARAGKYAFFKSNCYDRALAARIMLKIRRQPATLYFGVAKNEQNQLIAHAWVRCYEEIITGKQGMERFTIVGVFGK